MCARQAVAGWGPAAEARHGLRTRLAMEHPQTVEPQVLVDPLDARAQRPR
jgi:hypothetical protein